MGRPRTAPSRSHGGTSRREAPHDAHLEQGGAPAWVPPARARTEGNRVVSTKTPNNEGSVYQRQSDGRWVAAVTPPSGRRRVVYGPTEKAAIRERRKLLA